MASGFTPSHRGGSGTPLVCLHGFGDTWRSWELVLPALERHHDVLAVTLAGHAGGPPLEGEVDDRVLADEVERALDEAGLETAHVVGNSLGGFVALQLAERGRARTVVALAPAGGWAVDDESYRALLAAQLDLVEALEQIAPYTAAILASEGGARRATAGITVRYEHIPLELIAHLIRGAAACDGARELVDYALRAGWSLDAARIACPVRVVWGTEDAILPWPSAAVRLRDVWLPHADWVVLEGVGHCPHLDVPLETAELILDFTSDAR